MKAYVVIGFIKTVHIMTKLLSVWSQHDYAEILEKQLLGLIF